MATTTKRYYKLYKENNRWVLASPIARDRKPNTRVGDKISYTDVGFYYCINRLDVSESIPIYQFDGCIPPLFENGKIALNKKDVNSDKFNWDTVKWGNPEYPWEAPHLNSRFWKRQDGKWGLVNGRWKILYPKIDSK